MLEHKKSKILLIFFLNLLGRRKCFSISKLYMIIGRYMKRTIKHTVYFNLLKAYLFSNVGFYCSGVNGTVFEIIGELLTINYSK